MALGLNRNSWQMSGDILGCHDEAGAEGASGTLVSRHQEAAKGSTMHRTSPRTKNYLTQKVNSIKGKEKKKKTKNLWITEKKTNWLDFIQA